ncbi:MAG TPA: glycosyl hydrolase family 65 protein [Kiritimatiellia bacterium]|nr:glycosyl hydrolase family 65 protein [Kiritimatiellia bacterium]
MAKVADKYLAADPWCVIEEGFHPDRSRVSESIFSLSNEYMGVRGTFDEGYGGETLVGTYLNGVFEETPIGHPVIYPGIATTLKFMVNSPNPFATRIRCGDQQLDLHRSAFRDFRRSLDLRTGVLSRTFTWELGGGRELAFAFERWLGMTVSEYACQRIRVTANFDGALELDLGIDCAIRHMNTGGEAYWNVLCSEAAGESGLILARTRKTGHYALAAMRVEDCAGTWEAHGGALWLKGRLAFTAGAPVSVTRRLAMVAIKQSDRGADELWMTHRADARRLLDLAPGDVLAATTAYWDEVWRTQDIEIDGDLEQQQGIRYCIFQLHQTYHGMNPAHNVGAKGLTGEAYHGNTFWDTETYCLPFYMFNNPQAARNLLSYRYRTLPQAIDWARQQDAAGAFYPMATIDGTEGCGVWWHGNLEIHVSAAVAYGVWHYDRICRDREFLYREGLEMLIQISRFFASRGNWGPDGTYGYYGVMGPDEFHTFVNNNCYTNVMAAKCFQWTRDFLRQMERDAPAQYTALSSRLELTPREQEDWETLRRAMKVPFDKETGLYEQHDGYFGLPHLDIHSIPVEQFPLYHSWSLPRIYRYDMIKQPDVLLLMLFFSADYSLDAKRANYLYYEARCIHESSLSPSVHSILSAELGRHEEAAAFSHYATRLDLDNYNRNTGEGLHTTSIAAAWMNVVYGYGGLRSDGDTLALRPTCPAAWKGFSFRFRYRGSLLEVRVTGERARIRVLEGAAVELLVHGNLQRIGDTPLVVDCAGLAAAPLI